MCVISEESLESLLLRVPLGELELWEEDGAVRPSRGERTKEGKMLGCRGRGGFRRRPRL